MYSMRIRRRCPGFKLLLGMLLVCLLIPLVIRKVFSINYKQTCRDYFQPYNCSETSHLLVPTKSGPDYGLLDVYDLTKNSGDPSECVPLKILSNPNICIHNTSQDWYVSGSLKKHGVWEPNIMKLFRDILASDKHLGVIDIGANLGLYSLIGAAMGRKVLAVEPFNINIAPFHKAVKLNGFHDKVHLVTNAISNKREKVFFKTYAENKGGTSMWEGREECIKKKCPFAMSVYMDDLIPLIKEMELFNVIMKIDVEGAEHLALAEAASLFKRVNIRFIFMEIIIQTRFCRESIQDSEDKHLVMKMFDFLVKQGFTRVFPAAMKNPNPLNPTHCSDKWPRDVLWVHESQKYPF